MGTRHARGLPRDAAFGEREGGRGVAPPARGARTGDAMRRGPAPTPTREILRHWREAVPDDRLAHLVKDATRALVRALQTRLGAHGVSFGHWTFLRVLWEHDGITQRELSAEAGGMEPTTFGAVKAM